MSQPRFQLVPGARLVASGGGAGIGWRLLGANNRELGRSARAFADAEAALDQIARVRTLASRGEAHIVHERETGLWAWHLDDASVTVATSGRGFRHERECRYNLDQFRDMAPTAPAHDRGTPTAFPWQRPSAEGVQTESAS